MWVTVCRIGWGLVPRLMIICRLLAAELAEDWFQGLSKGWWLYVSIHVPKRKFNSNSPAFRFGSESSKTNSEKTMRLLELETEVPKRIVNSNFCFSIWEPKRIVELDFRFSFWSGSSKTNSEKSTSANDNWFWSGDGEWMAEKYTDRAGRV